ncbi:hypothetical protein BDZ45DRAFT_745893 [Acephala macrosclerotiorum]|nr:hypothetical protein BDZ45DRAFT_745893 [Acephala macrosclerotiorum]
MARVKRAASQISEPFRSANLWASDDTIINIDPMAYWDAAHPLPPPRLCQGLNYCILDASNFVAAVARIKIEQGKKEVLIAGYTKEMIKRGTEEVKLSLKTALTVHDWAVVMESPLIKHGITKPGTSPSRRESKIIAKIDNSIPTIANSHATLRSNIADSIQANQVSDTGLNAFRRTALPLGIKSMVSKDGVRIEVGIELLYLSMDLPFADSIDEITMKAVEESIELHCCDFLRSKCMEETGERGSRGNVKDYDLWEHCVVRVTSIKAGAEYGRCEMGKKFMEVEGLDTSKYAAWNGHLLERARLMGNQVS